jgi:hypothetical protein
MEVVQSAPVSFTVGDKVLDMVQAFKYLGRVIARDDSDLAAYHHNIAHARTKWTQISRVLRRDKASKYTMARFYMAIVSTVLLYGSETWVLTRRINMLLEAFHNRAGARTISGVFIRKRGGDAEEEAERWVYPSVEAVLKLAHIQPVGTYLDRRRVNFRGYADERLRYKQCQQSDTWTYPFPTLWEQLDNTIMTTASPYPFYG